jgi:hypothetical protein
MRILRIYFQGGRKIENFLTNQSEADYVSAAKTNRLMLFGETLAICCENHMKYTDTLCGHYVQLKLMVHILTTGH